MENKQKKPKNLTPYQLHDWLESNKELPILVDVREAYEIEIAPFPYKIVHMPLSESNIWMTNLSKYLSHQISIVVICHAGLRSWNFAVWLIEQGWEGEIWNLDGGIDSWSINIDSKVPRY